MASDTLAEGLSGTQLANAVTGSRIFGSVLLALVPAFSAPFYALCLLCGLSDMADGAIARITGSASSFGARLDTIADVLFAAVSLAKLLPLTFGAIELQYSAGIACFLATLAAAQEGYYVNTGRAIMTHPERNPTHET